MMTLTKEDLCAIEGLFTGKFDGIDKHFEKIDERFDKMDQRMDAMDERFDKIDQRFESLERKVTDIDLRLEHVESDVSSLKVGQIRMNDWLTKIDKKLDDTYTLALDNWGQIEESKGRLALLES